jgi:polysaccharide biosynthesis protein PslG
MPAIGYIRKKEAGGIDKSPWGIQYLLSSEGNPYPHDHLVKYMGAAGCKWTRITPSWRRIEAEPGRYDWGELEQVVEGVQSRGVNVFLGTGCSPHPAYHDFPQGYIYPPTDDPEALDAFCRYAAELVRHFRDRVRHFQIWNEPNIALFWRPEPDAKAYALMVRRVSAAMREVDPDIKILAGVMAGVTEERREWAREFLSEPGTPEAFDIFDYHAYNPSPDATLEDVLAVKELVHEFAPEMPIWQGECGCPSSGDTIHFRGDAPWGYNVQSKWLLRRLLTDRLAGAEVSIYFLMNEFFGNLLPGSPDLRTGYNTKGLVQHTTWQVKPAYYTFQNLAACIDSTWKQVDEPVEIEVVDPGVFYGIGPHEDRFPCVIRSLALQREDVPMLAYWIPWRPQEIVQPATVDVKWEGVEWDEPVVVDLMTGEVTAAERVDKALRVPMSDCPMLLAERASLDLADAPQQPSYEEIVDKLRWTY